MVKFLVKLKQQLPFLWTFIEWLNGFVFKLLFADVIKRNLIENITKRNDTGLIYRFLVLSDLPVLEEFFKKQDQEQFRFFKPHHFDQETLGRLLANPSFFMMGVFDGKVLIGYFFLRCFVNRHCFTGRIVDGAYQGRGIAKTMGRILLNTAWDSAFRVFGTASRENIKSLSSYKSINDFKIIRELDNGYIYFEYLKDKEKKESI